MSRRLSLGGSFFSLSSLLLARARRDAAPLHLALPTDEPRALRPGTLRLLPGDRAQPAWRDFASVGRRPIRFRARSDRDRGRDCLHAFPRGNGHPAACSAMRRANRSTRCARSRRARWSTSTRAAGLFELRTLCRGRASLGRLSLLQPLCAPEYDRGRNRRDRQAGRPTRQSWVTRAKAWMRERAHVHVELNLLLNDHFEQWHDT